jgi:predicted DNA-binding transcriptional regulator YafY
MRADRLLSLLLILQSRGRQTAGALAAELEVSVRTVYRDLDALSAAGVPVYAERGPGGGCLLLDSYRTTLTGLTDAEVRALFAMTVPAALAQLGLGAELKAALLKLSAALPAERHRQGEAWVRQRIHLDWSGGGQAEGPVPHLPTLQQAVWHDRRLWLAYRTWAGPGPVRLERLVDPYGLVAHLGAWYLVCAAGGRLRVYRASTLLEARLTGDSFERPADFDLAAFWAGWCAARDEDRASFVATVRLSPAIVPYLPLVMGPSAPTQAQLDAARPDPAGWLTLALPFEGLEIARGRLLSLGAAAEVLAPPALRLSLADYGAQIAALYGNPPQELHP